MSELNKKLYPLMTDVIRSKIGGGYLSVPWLIGQERQQDSLRLQMIG